MCFAILPSDTRSLCFDLAMMSEIVGCSVVHNECMVRGGHVCRFKFKIRK